MDKDLIINGYNQAAEAYLQVRNTFDNTRYLEVFISLLQSGSHILDLGCGAGIPVDKLLVERGFAIKGVDISTRQIELARQNVPQANFEVKDMSGILPGEYTVDGIISLYAIYHL